MKKLVSILSVSVLLGIYACSDTLAPSLVEEPVQENRDEMSNLVFNISIPSGDALTYAPSEHHDSAEWTVASLWMYEFNADGTKLLSDPVNIKDSLHETGPGYTYIRPVPTEEKSARRFVFVANEAPGTGSSSPTATFNANSSNGGTVLNIVRNSTLDQLKLVQARKILATGDQCDSLLTLIPDTVAGDTALRIPMTGEAIQGSSPIIAMSGSTAPIKVELTRILARIDVTNNTPNLLITGLKLSKTMNRSYLFETRNFYDEPIWTRPNGFLKPINIQTYDTIPHLPLDSFKMAKTTTFDGLSDSLIARKMTKAFYLYEQTQSTAANDTVYVQVTGKLGNVDVFYNIPMWNGDQPVTIKRNHLYNIIIGDGKTTIYPGTMVEFKIEDTDWNEVIVNDNFEIFTARYTGSAADSCWNDTTHVFTADSAAYAGDSIKFEITNQFSGHSTYTAYFSTPKVPQTSSVLEYTNPSTTKPSWITTAEFSGTDNKDFVIRLAENTSYEPRYCHIDIYSSANRDDSNITSGTSRAVRYRINIVQTGKKKPDDE